MTDYKTGRKVFDITSFYHGLQLQLPVYLNAALEAEGKRYPGKEIVPAGIFYYRIQDPIVAREKTDKKTEESILKELKLDGLVNGEEEVVEHLEANLTGSSYIIRSAGIRMDYLGVHQKLFHRRSLRRYLLIPGRSKRN